MAKILMTRKLKVYFLVNVLLLLSNGSFAQVSASSSSVDKSIFNNRLCKTWHMDKMVHGTKTTASDDALKDFVLIINEDHTVKQGMYPDGLIKGTWSLDENAMLITVKDEMTAVSYPMKILSLTASELVLQDPSSASSLTIYYKSK